MPDQFRLKETTDYVHYYFPVGESLFNGNGIVLQGMPAMRYPPGMPLLVAVSLKIQSFTNIDVGIQHKVLIIIYIAGAALSLFFFLKGFLDIGLLAFAQRWGDKIGQQRPFFILNEE